MKIETTFKLTFDETEKIDDIFRTKVQYLLHVTDTNQTELANAIGTIQTTISKFVSGKSGISLESIEKIGKYFGYTVSEMVSREEFVIKKEIIEEDISKKKESYYQKKKKR